MDSVNKVLYPIIVVMSLMGGVISTLFLINYTDIHNELFPIIKTIMTTLLFTSWMTLIAIGIVILKDIHHED